MPIDYKNIDRLTEEDFNNMTTPELKEVENFFMTKPKDSNLGAFSQSFLSGAAGMVLDTGVMAADFVEWVTGNVNEALPIGDFTTRLGIMSGAEGTALQEQVDAEIKQQFPSNKTSRIAGKFAGQVAGVAAQGFVAGGGKKGLLKKGAKAKELSGKVFEKSKVGVAKAKELLGANSANIAKDAAKDFATGTTHRTTANVAAGFAKNTAKNTAKSTAKSTAKNTAKKATEKAGSVATSSVKSSSKANADVFNNNSKAFKKAKKELEIAEKIAERTGKPLTGTPAERIAEAHNRGIAASQLSKQAKSAARTSGKFSDLLK